MTDLSSIGYGHGNPVGPLNRTSSYLSPSANGQVNHARSEGAADRDRVELSEHARLLDQLRRMPDMRLDRIEAVRQAIQEGSYETQDKLDMAIDRLLEDL